MAYATLRYHSQAGSVEQPIELKLRINRIR
jgi:hypothetical protein